jgi:hypothetical protein
MTQLVQKGSFMLSLDTELAWGGVHDRSYLRRSHLFEGTRNAIARLIVLLERYEIRATWAVVGHLFLDKCGPVNGTKHYEVVRPTYSWMQGDWFDGDPCTNLENAPFWYAPDIVENILNCRTPQEIGCHGFSHIIAGDPGCSPECFESELKASQAAARQWGITLKSFVFPRNSIGHLDVLATNGFTSYRGVLPRWHDRLTGPAKRVGRMLDNTLPVPTTTAMPQHTEGLWNLPATCFYLHREGWARRIPIGMRVQKANLGMRRAANDGSLFHLWFHPFNLASDPDGLLRGLESIFEEVARLRDSGKLENPTMGELAQHMNAPELNRKIVV